MYTEPKPPDVPCPVCEGAGYWDKRTGRVIWTRPVPEGLHRCPYCEGEGRVVDRRP